MKKKLWLGLFLIFLGVNGFSIYNDLEIVNNSNVVISGIFAVDNSLNVETSDSRLWKRLGIDTLYYGDSFTASLADSDVKSNYFNLLVVSNYGNFYIIRGVNKFQGVLYVNDRSLESITIDLDASFGQIDF
ncbi:MAG: hypothetical protein JXR63_04910 [Spirochaetales bacterium]|nr:hypothetical protein [Spirochaetales bacterium]